MKISVVIPTHNRSQVIRRAIESVQAQTRAADEIIVIDDGSDDATADILNSIDGIVYHRQSNHGVSHARNTGITMASGDWIALLDSDDEWLPHKLAQQAAVAQQDPDSVLVHTEEIWIRNGVRVNQMHKHQKHGGWIFQHCLPLCAISPSSAMIRKEVFDDVGLFDEKLPACEDYDLWLRLCAKYPVNFIEQACIVKYGGHDDQLSRRHWGMDRFRIYALQKILDSRELNETQAKAAREMLLKKSRIFIKGAHKRDKQDEVAYYQALIDRYSTS